MKPSLFGLWHTTPPATVRLKGILSNAMQCAWAVSRGIVPTELIEQHPSNLIVAHHSNDISGLVRAGRRMKSPPHIAVTASSELDREEADYLKQLEVSLLKLPRNREEECIFLEALAAIVQNNGHEGLAIFSQLAGELKRRPRIVDSRIIPFKSLRTGNKRNIVHPLNQSLDGYYAIA